MDKLSVISRRALLAVSCAAYACASVLAFPVNARADVPSADAELAAVGRVPVASPPNRQPAGSSWNTSGAQLIVNPVSRRGYRIFNVGSERSPEVAIGAFDLDGYATTGSVRIPTGNVSWRLEPDSRTYSGMPYAVHGSRGLIFLPIAQDGATKAVFVIDEDRIGKSRSPVVARAPFVSGPQVPTPRLFGMRMYEAGGAPKLLISYVRGSQSVGIRQWDVGRLLAGQSNFEDWDYPALAGCQFWWPSRTQVPIWRTDQHVFTACVVSGGGRMAAVRLSIGPNGAPLPASEELYPGPPGFSPAALGDPSGNRVHVLSSRGNGSELWTFDFSAGRWVGRSGITIGDSIGDAYAFGLDESSGRVYALVPHQSISGGVPSEIRYAVPGGLLSIEGRLTPVPQPRLHSEIAYPAVLPIQVDTGHASGRPRIFVRRAYLTEDNPTIAERAFCPAFPAYPKKTTVRWCAEKHWKVVEDRLPPAANPTPADQDRLTIDVAPRQGVTGSSYEASSSGWTARVRLVAGAEGVPSMCAPFNRVGTTGWVLEAKLAANERLARSVAVDVDDVTKADLEAPASRCQPSSGNVRPDPVYKSLDAFGQKWDLEHASCTDHGATRSRYERLPFAVDLSAGASCSTTLIEADASASIGIPGLLRVADGLTRTTVRSLGADVQVETETRLSGVHVDLGGGVLRIDGIRTVAKALSNGRPRNGTSGASFERTVCGVHGFGVDTNRCYRDLLGAVCGVVEHEQSDAMCKDEVSTLASTINARMGGRGAFRAPSPDLSYLAGSPGGYVAAVQKRAADQFDDQLLNGDFSKEVPSIEIIREDYPRRQLIQLAGVRALTTYGINCLPPTIFDKQAKKCVTSTLNDEGDAGPSWPPALVTNVLDPAADADPLGAGRGVTSATLAPASGNSWRVLMLRPLGEGLLAAAAWFSLGAPVVLALLRWRALRTLFEEKPL